MSITLSVIFRIIVFIYIVAGLGACFKDDQGNDVNPDATVPKNTIASKDFGTKQLGIASADTIGRSIAIDNANSVYVTGDTNGGLNGIKLKGSQDAFVVKYSSSGSVDWFKQFGATSAITSGKSIATDNDSNVYVTGFTGGALGKNTLAGTRDGFIIKFNSNGSRLWIKQFGTTTAETVGNGIATDNSGNVYVAGVTNGALGGNIRSGEYDFFITKFNSSGKQQWTKQLGVTEELTIGNGISTDNRGNIFVTGGTSGVLKGNTKIGFYDAFIIKYDPNGVKQWLRQLGTENELTEGNSITTDSQGNAVITGQTGGALDGIKPSSAFNLFVTKYNSTGKKQWTKLVAGSGGSETNGYSISSDTSDNVFVTGFANDSIIKNTAVLGSDLFVVKFSSAGKRLLTIQPGIQLLTKQPFHSENAFFGTGLTMGNGISISRGGDIYVTGETRSEGLGGNKTSGNTDSFVIKFEATK